MTDKGIVRGSESQSKAVIVGTDTVYVHTDIEPVTKDSEGNSIEGLFQYHEIQYEKDEYIQLIGKENTNLKHKIETMQGALDSLLLGDE